MTGQSSGKMLPQVTEALLLLLDGQEHVVACIRTQSLSDSAGRRLPPCLPRNTMPVCMEVRGQACGAHPQPYLYMSSSDPSRVTRLCSKHLFFMDYLAHAGLPSMLSEFSSPNSLRHREPCAFRQIVSYWAAARIYIILMIPTLKSLKNLNI